MAKRKSKHSKIEKISSSSSVSSENTESLYSSPKACMFAQYSFENSSSLTYLEDLISDIYYEYIKDLKARRSKRLKLKIPTSETHPYNLVISESHLISLKSKIHDLLLNNNSNSLQVLIDQIIEKFISQLHDFLKESSDKSRLLQIVYLYEVYHTLENSISEISKIVVELYSFQEFANLNLHKFYNNILGKQKNLMKFAKTQDNKHFAVRNLVRIQEELDLMMKTGEIYQNCVDVENFNDVDQDFDDHVHSLPLEEVINYINGSSYKEKRKSKMKKEPQVTALDQEITEFENRLAVETPNEKRLSPCCSLDFLRSLKDKYLEIRTKLLNN